MKQYEKLITQYKNLSEEKRNALLVYKSRLSYCINEISSIESFENLEPLEILNSIEKKGKFLDIYLETKTILKESVNIFLKLSVYKKVNFENELEFIKSLKEIYLEIIDSKERITTEEDLKLYRAIPIEEETKFLSKGDLISTSLDVNVCEEFIKFSKDFIIYEINIPKGSPVLICPYEIKSNISLDSIKLKLTDIPTQQEIILNKSDFDFEIEYKKEGTLDSGEKIIAIKINSKQKEKKHIKG